MSDRPFAGLRVVELGQVLAAPFAGAIFADLSAKIVQVASARVSRLQLRWDRCTTGTTPRARVEKQFGYICHRMFERKTFRLTAWLACLAMLMAAFAPTMSRALAAQGGADSQIMICTAAGMRFVDARQDGLDEPASPTQKAAAQGDCPYCSSAGHAPALPVEDLTRLGRVDRTLVRAREPARPTLPSNPITAPFARGPPPLA